MREADVAIAARRIVGIGRVGKDFQADRTIDARGCWLLPGLIDLQARLREPGEEHRHLLESEMAAAAAGGVTSLVCPPDTDPVLDEPGLVQMLKMRTEQAHHARLFPLGALTRGLEGQALTEMAELTHAGCVGFGQADHPIKDTAVLQRAMQYAHTHGLSVWLQAMDAWLGGGVAASGPLAMRMGLSGVPVIAETLGLHRLLELVRSTGVRLHVTKVSSAAAVDLLRQAKAEGLPVTADVSVHSLHLTDLDMGWFDSRARLSPPLRQQRDRDALRAALADGTIDALVSDHNPLHRNAKDLPFADAEPGATAIELLLNLALKWAEEDGVPLPRALEVVTAAPARVLGTAVGTLQASLGHLIEGGVADICVFDPAQQWQVGPGTLRSQGKSTPFEGMLLQGKVKHTLAAGYVSHGA
jgi:dihydroorotase